MTIHKTSSSTFIYQYLFVPLWGGAMLFSVISLWSSNDEVSGFFVTHVTLMTTLALSWLIPLMLRLRRAEANEHHIVLKKFSGTETISYADIEYVSQPLFINPKLISIRYADRESGTSKNILLIPPRFAFEFNFFGEREMTQFIRQQVLKFNPTFTREAEPPRWKLFTMVMGSVAALLLTLVYFLMPGEV